MSHDIMRRNGKDAMWCVGDRDAAWHRLGQRTPNAVTWEDAVKLADLDWQVTKHQLYARNPLKDVVSVPMYATMRSDDGAYLGCVGEGYHVIQNRELFTSIDSLLGVSNGAHYESAGALGNGERVWCLARIPEADFEIDGGDKHRAFVLAASSHDMSLSNVYKIVAERVVCSNTLAVAMSESGATFKIRHTVSAEQRLKLALSIMRSVKGQAVSLKEKFERLAARKLTRESVEHVLDRLFPKPKEEGASETRRDGTLSTVLSLYEANDQNAYPSIQGSAYNLLNAVTEFADHFRTARGNGSKPEQVATARAESALFGSGERLKTQALQVICEEVDQDTVDAGIRDLDPDAK